MGKTAVEMIEEIWRKVETLERRFSNIEMLMKELLNKANTTKVEKQEPKQEPKVAISASKPEFSQIPKSINSASDLMEKNVSKVKIMGQIKNKDGKYVSGVKVKVYNAANDELVRETLSNKGGEWMFLMPAIVGKYRAEYFLENIINKKVEFNVQSGQTLIRVAQPK